MITILPQFTIELEEKLNKVIAEIVDKNNIDLLAVEDSKSIEEGKRIISNTLVRIYEKYDVEGRKRLENFQAELKPGLKNERLKGQKVKNEKTK